MRVLSPTAAAQTPIKQKDPVRLPAMERAFLPARTNHCCALCSVITPTSDGHGRLDDTRTCSLDANRILFPRLSSPIPTHFSITTYLIQCAGAPLVLYQEGRLYAETCNQAMHPKTSSVQEPPTPRVSTVEIPRSGNHLSGNHFQRKHTRQLRF